MQLVLHGCIENPGDFTVWIIVDAAFCVDISDFLIETAFRGTYFTDAFQELIKVILAKVPAIFEPLVVKHKSLDDILPQGICGPDPKLGCPGRVDTITYGDDSVEVVKLCFIVFTVNGSMCKNCTNCFFFKLSFFKDISQVFCNLSESSRYETKGLLRADSSSPR
jgi:hypothetical protein